MRNLRKKAIKIQSYVRGRKERIEVDKLMKEKKEKERLEKERIENERLEKMDKEERERIKKEKEENGIEILTVSGVGKNCSIKNIKKGTNILYNYHFYS